MKTVILLIVLLLLPIGLRADDTTYNQLSDSVELLDTLYYWELLDTIQVCDTVRVEIDDGVFLAEVFWNPDENTHIKEIYYHRSKFDTCLFCPDSISGYIYYMDSIICRDLIVIKEAE